ncbi:valine--tRNA ligase [Candidatus Kaiserbacteria bacterium]|nr:valine--tRNA ligase [Candidatus Kaiserbacteria bacterium]
MDGSKAPEVFLKPYDPAAQEPKILEMWEKSGYANPDVCVEKGVTKPDAESYSIVLPPPNVTGTLHMGHAAMLAVEDILIRYHRMRGYKTLWLPGTDSAAIATQSKVETDIYKKEKKTRHDLGREELLRRIDEFVEESKATIINQTKKMGSSLDWSRYAYTMDPPRYRAVMEAFMRMYEAGLIYRGNRIVNWDPKLQTTVSDDEIEYVEQKDPFYYFQYGPFVMGTVRPETKFGDKCVIINPADERYKKYKHGQKIDLEWIDGPITATVIHDPDQDMEFGSGVMTITAAHDAHDFELAQKYDLPVIQVIDDRGILLPIAGEFAGMHIKKARPAIVEKLKAKSLLVKVDENYVHNVATNSRGGGVIEPQIKRQWFIAVNKAVEFPDGKTMTLKERMREAVESSAIKIMPERFEKIYYHWIDNLRDWCISRQIWFGHRIPAWHHEPKCIPISGREADISKCIPIIVSREKPECQFCAAAYEQDPDTLDTWFSSGLWTFSTLGWPEDTKDLKTYHPTSVLETGYDIIFFWVARMILMSGFLLGDIPFRNVYLHGLVRDAKGRKMSKSLGNVIDPLDMVNKYGADAARLSLIIGAAVGNDIKLSEDRVRGYKHFANKLWNIARFVLESDRDPMRSDLIGSDQRLVDEVQNVVKSVSEHIDKFRLDLAADQAYHFVWDRFAAEIIEESKPILKAGGEPAASRSYTLYAILLTSLKLLHPFMPFVTEAIWQELPSKESDLLMVAKWPFDSAQGKFV